jgi:HSP20 family protein
MADMVRSQNAFEDLFDFRRDFDGMFRRLLSGSLGTYGVPRGLIVAVPPIEAWVDNSEKKYHLSIALPGIDPKQIQLSLQGDDLTVSGEQKASEEKKDKDFLFRELSYGRFERTMTLPEGVDTTKLSAEYRNGMLEIVAPLNAAALPKQIEIKSEEKAKNATA